MAGKLLQPATAQQNWIQGNHYLTANCKPANCKQYRIYIHILKAHQPFLSALSLAHSEHCHANSCQKLRQIYAFAITMTETNLNIMLPDGVDLLSMNRDDESPSPSSFELDLSGSNPDSFPTVLHRIVSNESSDDCIHWLPCGTHFAISDKEKVSFRYEHLCHFLFLFLSLLISPAYNSLSPSSVFKEDHTHVFWK